MKFSEFFGIKKSQAELDFIDIPLDTDIPLFLDPYALSRRNDNWSYDCHTCILDYFQRIVDSIRNSEEKVALKLLSYLSEPNETRLGLSKRKPKGKGVSGKQALDLHEKIKDSSAVKTGVLKELEECELYVKGIARDKISDVTTNIIKLYLIQYTRYQCELHNIRTRKDVASGFYWDTEGHEWNQKFSSLPVYKDKRIILVPKAIVRYDLAYDHKDYYNHFIVNFLQAEHFADGSLVRTLRSGEKKPPYKKEIKARYPISKDFIYSFTRDNPEVLKRYKNSLSRTLRELTNEELEAIKGNEKFRIEPVVDGLIKRLKITPPGLKTASLFHDIVIGVLEIIVYPNLMNPRKQERIHRGRKVIDISYSNALREGFFKNLELIHRFPCPNVFFECKNYSSDPANPEIDQLQGRFSLSRGMAGFLVCRKIKNKKLFLKRCKDVYKDERGCIIPLEDLDLIHLLDFAKQKKAEEIDQYLENKLRDVLST